MRGWWNSVDVEAKRIGFVGLSVFALWLMAGAVLYALTGDPSLLIAAVVVSGSVLGIFVVGRLLWKAAMRLFPEGEDTAR